VFVPWIGFLRRRLRRGWHSRHQARLPGGRRDDRRRSVDGGQRLDDSVPVRAVKSERLDVDRVGGGL
jgi:hypothetical protein